MLTKIASKVKFPSILLQMVDLGGSEHLPTIIRRHLLSGKRLTSASPEAIQRKGRRKSIRCMKFAELGASRLPGRSAANISLEIL